MGPKTLILIQLLEWVETNVIAKIINTHSNDYSWVKIGVRTAEIS